MDDNYGDCPECNKHSLEYGTDGCICIECGYEEDYPSEEDGYYE